ncbi:MAG: hypothetical protein HYR96_00540 [Deltaproteobacteria bacterium]|nr:hypothetical protein [Deltaproteobacteria bacterium]MBI3295821.1 hypothetical protein [Deltaproteobacteria bacterium]
MKTMITIGLAIALSGSAYASGFKCTSDEGLNVKLFNHVDPLSGTRTPAVLVISSDAQGTLIVRKDTEITKHNRANTVQYVVDGSEKVGAETAILQIRFKEGREVLEAREVTAAQLILVSEDNDRSVIALECERYLKAE